MNVATPTAPTCPPRAEVCPERPDLQRRYLEDPIASWCGRFLSRGKWHPVPEMHLDFYKIFRTVLWAVIKAPRSFAKSTVCIKDLTVYLCCEHTNLAAMEDPIIYPHKEIMIVGSNATEARKWLARIQEELLFNEDIVATYGDMRHPDPRKSWNQDEFWTKDGVHVQAKGAGTKFRGNRPTLLLCDDLDDDEAVRSDEQVEKNIDWWNRAVINMLDEDWCQCFVIGTTIEEVTLLEHICEMDSFEEFHFGAYLKDEFGEFVEEPGWESWATKWSHAKLKQREKDIGRRDFSAEFLNQPYSADAPLFEREWFKPYNPRGRAFANVLKEGVVTLGALDLAIKQQDGKDFTAIVTISIDYSMGFPRFFLRTGGAKQGHWTPGRAVSVAVGIYDDFYLARLGVEDVGYQEALAYWIEDHMKNHHRDIKVKRLPATASKETRARAVSPAVERGQVYYDPEDRNHVTLINQCVRFKAGKKNIKKDLMDAFVHTLKMCLDEIKKGKKKSKGGKVLPKTHLSHLSRVRQGDNS